MPVHGTAIAVKQMATPATPGASTQLLYPKTDGKWYTKDSDGVEALIGPPTALTTPTHAGFRNASNQAVAHATASLVFIPTTDHNVGSGISISSSVITLTNAGVYHFTASATFDAAGASARRVFGLEWWSGSAPSVSLGTQLAREEVTPPASTYYSASMADQVSLPAGAQVRLWAYQTSGSTINIANAIVPARVTVMRLS